MTEFNVKAHTTAARIAAFKEQFPAEHDFLLDNFRGSAFLHSLWTQMSRWGRLSEKQMACLAKEMAKAPPKPVPAGGVKTYVLTMGPANNPTVSLNGDTVAQFAAGPDGGFALAMFLNGVFKAGHKAEYDTGKVLVGDVGELDDAAQVAA